MRRLLLAVLTLGLALTAPAPLAAAGAPGNDTFRIKGMIQTTAASPDDPSTAVIDPLIVNSPTAPSVVSGMGRVMLHQPQVVTPAADGPAFGTHAAYRGTVVSAPDTYFQAADGARLYFSFVSSLQAFDPAPRIIPEAVPWPIAFPAQGGQFTMTFQGGTGRFAGATGTASGSGRYCFLLNGGYFTFAGTVTLPSR